MKLKHGYTIEEVIAFGNEKKESFTSTGQQADILGQVYLFKGTKDAKDVPVTSGYRPAHQIQDGVSSTGEHIYYENDVVYPGETAMAYITFLSPESYPHTLWVGKELDIKEASKVIGKATVIEVYNELTSS